jgi:DNA-binding CsgD family transcriptional regulator
MPADLDPAARGEILDAYAIAASSIEENPVAIEASRAAAAAFREAGMPHRAIFAMGGVLSAWRREGEPVSRRLELGMELWDELATLPPSSDPTSDANVRADAAANVLVAHVDANALEAATSWLAIFREAALETGDEDWKAFLEWHEGVLEVMTGDPDAGIARITAAAHVAEKAGFEMTGVTAFRDASVWASRTMDYDTATGLIDEGLRYADQIEQSHCAHLMSATGALIAWGDARWSDAAEGARQAVADHGCRKGANMARWALGYVLLGRGVLSEATAELTTALEFGIRSEAISLILPPMWGLAEAAILRGEADRAFELCQDALRRARDVGERFLLVPFVVTGVRAAQAAGRPAAAAGWYADIATDVTPLNGISAAALAHGRGLVLLADGATGIAKSSFEAAIRGWDEKHRIWEATWARLDLAYCLIRANRYAEGLAMAVDARATGSRLNSRSIADRADALARMARGRVAVDEPWRPLTAREYAVARLISEGMTNAEIADSLGIAPKTASSHVEHILAKLGASRRAEIATWASNVEHATNGRSHAVH